DLAAERMQNDPHVLQGREPSPGRPSQHAAFSRLAWLEREAGVVQHVGIAPLGRYPDRLDVEGLVKEVRSHIEGVVRRGRRGPDSEHEEGGNAKAAKHGRNPGARCHGGELHSKGIDPGTTCYTKRPVPTTGCALSPYGESCIVSATRALSRDRTYRGCHKC